VRRSRPATILSPRELSALDYRANKLPSSSLLSREYTLAIHVCPIEVAFRETFLALEAFYFAFTFLSLFLSRLLFHLGLVLGIGNRANWIYGKRPCKETDLGECVLLLLSESE
jgi:hypothetical protein